MQYRQNIEFSAKLAGASAESLNESSQHVFCIFNSLMNSANSNSYFFLLSSFFRVIFFKHQHISQMSKKCQNLTLPLACLQMAQMTQITQMCVSDCKCARMCAGVRRCAQVCAGVHRCAHVCIGVRVCTSVRCCERLYLGVSKCAQVCMCACGCVCEMNFQNTFWRLDFYHQRIIVRILCEFFLFKLHFFMAIIPACC